MTSRRGFFGRLIGAALAPVVAKLIPVLPESGIAIAHSVEPDLFLSMDEFATRYLAPACVELANCIDRDAMTNFMDYFPSDCQVRFAPRRWWQYQPKLSPLRLPA